MSDHQRSKVSSTLNTSAFDEKITPTLFKSPDKFMWHPILFEDFLRWGKKFPTYYFNLCLYPPIPQRNVPHVAAAGVPLIKCVEVRLEVGLQAVNLFQDLAPLHSGSHIISTLKFVTTPFRSWP